MLFLSLLKFFYLCIGKFIEKYVYFNNLKIKEFFDINVCI